MASRTPRRTGDYPAWVYSDEKMGRMAHDSEGLMLDTRPRSGAEGGMPYRESNDPKPAAAPGRPLSPTI